MTVHNDIYNQQLSNFLVGWHLLEAQNNFKDLGGLSVIDMNLSGKEIAGKPFASHKTALRAIEELAANIPNEAPVYLQQKVIAHQAYLAAYLDKKPDYTQTFRAVNGYQPYMFSTEQMHEQTDLAKAAIAELKIRGPLHDFEKNLANIQPSPKTPQALAALFQAKQKDYKQAIAQIINTYPDFVINYHMAKPDEFYVAYITGNGQSYDMYLNPREFENVSCQEAVNTAIHEVSGHAVNFSLIQKSLESNAGLSLVTVLEPQTFGSEGLALSLENMLPEMIETPVAVEALTHFSLTNRMAISNAALQLNMGEMTFKQALDYAQSHTPFRDRKFLKQRLKSFGSPCLAEKLYGGIYGHAETTWYDIAKKINTLPDDQKIQTRRGFLTQVYNNFTTATDVKLWQDKLGLKSQLVI